MIAPTRRVRDLRPGEPLPPLEQTFSAVDLVIYGAATWDWHRLHYDAAFAETLSLPAPLIDGQVYGALFARQALDWLGPRAFVKRLAFRMRSMAFAGATLRGEGEVAEVRPDGEHPVVVLGQRLLDGDRLVAEATTEVRLPE